MPERQRECLSRSNSLRKRDLKEARRVRPARVRCRFARDGHVDTGNGLLLVRVSILLYDRALQDHWPRLERTQKNQRQQRREGCHDSGENCGLPSYPHMPRTFE